MAKPKDPTRIPCTVEGCKDLVKPIGLKNHIRLKHGRLDHLTPTAELSDVKNKLTTAEARIKELESKAASPTDDTRKAILSDWLANLTREAWEEIGQVNGYFTPPVTPPDPLPAVLNDVKSSGNSIIPDNLVNSGRQVVVTLNHGGIVVTKVGRE